jgi:hypothetical protein
VFDADDGGHTLAGVIAGEVGVGFFQQVGAPGVIVDDAGGRSAQTGEVCTAVHGVDGVGKGIDGFIVRIGVLDSDLDANPIHLFFNIENRVKGLAVAIEEADKGLDTALKIEGCFLITAFILQSDFHFLSDKCHFPKTLGYGFETVINIILKNLRIKAESGMRASNARGAFSDHLHSFLGDAALVALEVNMPFTTNLHLAPFREGIYC